MQAAACNFIKKETRAKVFPCDFCETSKSNFFTKHLRANGLNKNFLNIEFCEIFKDTYFEERLRTAASANWIILLFLLQLKID